MVLALSVARVQAYLGWWRRYGLVDQIVQLLELGRRASCRLFVITAVFDHLVRCALLQGLFAF